MRNQEQVRGPLDCQHYRSEMRFELAEQQPEQCVHRHREVKEAAYSFALIVLNAIFA